VGLLRRFILTASLPPATLGEEIDPSYVPSEDEVVEYAKWLGMDLDKDQDLFWVAREGVSCTPPTLFYR